MKRKRVRDWRDSSDEEDIGLDSTHNEDKANFKKQKMDGEREMNNKGEDKVPLDVRPNVPPPAILEKLLGNWEGNPYRDLCMSNPEAFGDAVVASLYIELSSIAVEIAASEQVVE